VADKIQKAAGPWARAGHDHVCEDRFSRGPYPAQPLLAKDEIDSFDPLENLSARLPRTCRESAHNCARADMGLIREEEGASDLGIQAGLQGAQRLA
jgi:hypothetical protein